MDFKEWRKFWWPIDLIGIGIGCSLIVLYIFRSDFAQSEEVKNVWANIATELIGVWLSVRIIGVVLERKSKFHSARFHLLRNFTYFFNLARPTLKYHTDFSDEIFSLQKEVHYSNLRWKFRRKFLTDSELQKAVSLCALQKDIVDKLKDIQLEIKSPDYVADGVKYQNLKMELQNLIGRYHDVMEDLRMDIWEETHPDLV